MSGYATAVGWGAFVLCAMVGWGSLFYGALGLRGSSDWSRRAAAGFAFSACIGGVVDLTAVISRWLIIGFLAVGGIAFVHRLVQYAATTKPMMRPKLGSRLLNVPVLSAAAALLALRIAGSVIVLQPSTGMQLGSFNTFDDFQAYVVYPLKMLDTGSMGADPFSIRRTPTQALGGGAFLQTFVLAALPVENLRLLDVGLGTLLVIGLLWSYMGRMGLTAFAAAAVILVFLAIPPPLINVTAVLIPLALFLSLFLIFEDSELHMPRLSRAALIGLHVAAICVLKTSLIPAALGFVGVRWALALLHSSSKREVVLDGVMWFIAAGMAILPWLLDSYRWTGTFLPEGLAAYGADPSRVAGFQAVTGWHFFIQHLKELPLFPYTYFVMLVVVLLVVRPKPKVSEAFWSLLAGAAIGTAGVVVAVAGAVNDIDRFMYAFVMGALLVALIQAIAALTGSGATGRTKRLALLGVSVATVVLVLSTAREAREMYSYNLLTVRRALRGEQLIAESATAKYRNLQNALPQKAVLLEHMDYPFLFDFRRNRILIDDQPGSASLAPGQPFFAGAEALARYLVLNGIQYVAYDYATEAGVSQESFAALANNDRAPSAQAVVRLTFDFHRNLMELGRTRQRIFDDGTAFAVDLLAPSR